MKALVLCLLFTCTLLTVSAQSWKENRPVSGFTGIQVSAGIELILSQGSSEKLSLDVNGFDKDDVRTIVKNGILQLSIDRRNQGMSSWDKSRRVKAYLTFKQLKSIEASSGSEVNSQNQLAFNDLSLSASSGCNLELDMKASDLSLDVSNGADATLRGSARSLSVRVSSGAQLDASKLTTETCNAQASGGADASVYATKELRLQASGGADLSYSGPASVVTKQKSGGADISKK